MDHSSEEVVKYKNGNYELDSDLKPIILSNYISQSNGVLQEILVE